MNNLWYAVQHERSDAWDYGSFDYDEACRMLKEQGEGWIAVIQNGNHCIDEIAYEDLV